MALSDNIVYQGTYLKLSISISGINDGGSFPKMGSYPFMVEMYTNPNNRQAAKFIPSSLKDEEPFKVTNSDHVRIVEDASTEGSYLILVNTEVFSPGELKCKLVALIEDDDFSSAENEVDVLIDDKVRKEVTVVNTGITIEKAI